MMRKKKSNFSNGSSLSTIEEEDNIEWEMRPGGMLVQKRCNNTTNSSVAASVPVINLRISYGSFRYNISTNSQATFGELKKLLASESGLQPTEQKIIFRGKERQNGDYLDFCGVKERSKITLVEDPSSREKRYIEMRRNTKLQSVHRAISDISMEVDKLAEQVTGIEKSISNEKKVADVQITTLIEMLMRQAVKLESISTQGDASAQKSLQSKRVQKCVETLDALKITNANIKPKIVPASSKWETFDPPATANRCHQPINKDNEICPATGEDNGDEGEVLTKFVDGGDEEDEELRKK